MARGGIGADPWAPNALIYRFAVNALGLFLAGVIVPGIRIDDWPSLLAATAIFALVNIIVRPAAIFVSFCLIALTFGLFILVINAALLAATAWVAGQLDLAFHVDGFWPAMFGAIIISLVSFFATMSLRVLRL
jgi:putative membrane protein